MAVIEISEGEIKIGDQIMVGEEGTGFTQVVESMEVDHKIIKIVKKGEEAGLKLNQQAKEGDNVYLIVE